MSDKKGSSEKLLYCSFCGKSQHEVKKLIAGPSVFICDECIDLCNEIIRDELPAGDEQREAPLSAGTSSRMMSLHSSMHSSQMNTDGPAMSFFTSCWLLPQKEQ